MITIPPTDGNPKGAAQSASELKAAKEPEEKQTLNSASDAALDKAIEKIPYVGPWIVYASKKLGWRSVLLVAVSALVSALVVIGLLYFGILPRLFISDKYFQATSVSAITTSTPLKGALDLSEIRDQGQMPRWLLDYHQFLLSSAADTLAEGAVKVFQLKNRITSETSESRWVLELASSSGRNYVIEDGRGFRVTESGLIQPLDTGGGTTQFKVPPCHKGDTLIAIVVYRRAVSPRNDSPPEFSSYAP